MKKKKKKKKKRKESKNENEKAKEKDKSSHGEQHENVTSYTLIHRIPMEVCIYVCSCYLPVLKSNARSWSLLRPNAEANTLRRASGS